MRNNLLTITPRHSCPVILGDALRVASTVIHRINYPKRAAAGVACPDGKTAPKSARNASLAAKSRPLLSTHDEQDTLGEVCALLVESGGVVDWQAAFSNVRRMLRIDRQHERHAGGDAELMALESLAIKSTFSPHIDSESLALRRESLAKRIRYARACVFRFAVSNPSRKAKARLRGDLATLRAVAWQTLFYRDMEEQDKDTAKKARARLVESIAQGESLLTADAESSCPPPKREFRALADLPAIAPPAAKRFRPRLAAALGFNP